tara:strand:- start:8561 stop:9979 length:1419 start_codon:yes stop_codon:yes gene_type:complete
MNLEVIILAGGSGSRLWPVSRSMRPKQFLNIHDESSMLSNTISRLSLPNMHSITVICNEEHRFFVSSQLEGINLEKKIITEPVGRNTAPAITLAALSNAKERLMLILPADHVIDNIDKFNQILIQATSIANNNKLVTFGIVPNEPNTGYGYIEAGEGDNSYFNVKSFHEKPCLNKAKEYIQDDKYFWNSGMFLFNSKKFISEIKKYREDIYLACKQSLDKSNFKDPLLKIDADSFIKSPSESIDCALMEKTTDAVVIPMGISWNDVGTWKALSEIKDKDSNGNTLEGDIYVRDTKNTYIQTEDSLVAASGIENLIIVNTKDALLVSSKDSSQDVKEIVDSLKNDNRQEYKLHKKVFRPWGSYESLVISDGYQVKKLTVYPLQKLSVQMHYKRSEHWVVVKGKAKITNGKEIFTLQKNESTYIPVETVHALENPSNKEDLEIIEVQTGTYFGEDDIVRFEDRYGRIAENKNNE